MSPIDDLRFLNAAADIRTTENRLPHWEQDGRTYFVTFRTGDSIPAELARVFQAELDIWLGAHPKPWCEKIAREYWERFGSRLEKWLDEGHGACALRSVEIARIVGRALQFHEGQRCTQSAWVVMPNHVHALFSLTGSEELSRLLHSWKSFTASEINRRIGQSGTFWQKDYFDRLIRNAKHFWACARYIRKNPAKLRPGTFLHWEAECPRRMRTRKGAARFQPPMVSTAKRQCSPHRIESMALRAVVCSAAGSAPLLCARSPAM